MSFTLDTLADELGIPRETLSAKSDVVAKWNGYLSEADSKYTQATAAQKAAETTLEAAKNEQRVIDENIAKFGMTEANILALQANNAAMEASLKKLKEQGLDVTIPTAPVINKPAEFDPNSFRNDVNTTLKYGFKASNDYQRIFGKPIPDDIDVLANEAAQQRMPFMDYVAKKYDFAGEQQKKTQAAAAAHDAEIRAAAVKEYQEKNPVVQGNADLQRGVASRHPHIVRERPGQENKTFSNLPARSKIAQSVSRTREALKSA